MLDLITLENLPNTWIGKLTNAIRYFKGYSFHPFFISFIITHRCNLKCSFCYQKNCFKTKELDFNFNDLELLENNINSLTFKPNIHIFGGEPTLHPNFLDIMKFFDEKNYRLYLTTNGTKLNELSDDLIKLNNLKEINISLCTQKWSEYIRNIKKLKENENIRVNLCLTISPKNCKKFSDIVETFNNKVDSIVFLHLMFDKQIKNSVNYNEILSQMSKINKNYNTSIRFFPSIKTQDIEKYYENPTFPEKNKCLRPWFVLFILPTGEVIPCEQLKPHMIGNLKKEPLCEIWNNEKFRNYRKRIHEKGIFINCSRCCHRQFY